MPPSIQFSASVSLVSLTLSHTFILRSLGSYILTLYLSIALSYSTILAHFNTSNPSGIFSKSLSSNRILYSLLKQQPSSTLSTLNQFRIPYNISLFSCNFETYSSNTELLSLTVSHTLNFIIYYLRIKIILKNYQNSSSWNS